MDCIVYSTEGKELRGIYLEDAVFGLSVNEAIVWYAINNELANKRIGAASTKDRGEIRGSNAKPYKQKGTGRARQGDRKSPVLVGGGTVFGPKPRDFSYSLPKKVKQCAVKTVLSLKAQNDVLKIVEDFSVVSGKTKDLSKLLGNFGETQRTVIILKDDDFVIKRAGANIPWLYFLCYNRLCVHDLFYSRRVILLETAAKSLNTFYKNDMKEFRK
jgi:large subunit ribosomal protein L4